MLNFKIDNDDVIETLCGIIGILVCIVSSVLCIVFTNTMSLLPASIIIFTIVVICCIVSILLYTQSRYGILQIPHIIAIAITCCICVVSSVNAVFGIASYMVITNFDQTSTATILDIKQTSESSKTLICEVNDDRYLLSVDNKNTLVIGDVIEIKYCEDSNNAYPSYYNVDMTLDDLLHGTANYKPVTKEFQYSLS